MESQTENEKRLEAAAEVLARQMRAFFVGRELNHGAMRKIREKVQSHRERCARAGLAFPKMAALIFPRIGEIKLVRQDLERRAIELTMVNLTREFPALTAREIADAVAGAFPHHRPGMPESVH